MEGVLKWAGQEHSPNTVLDDTNIDLVNLQAAAQSQGPGSIRSHLDIIHEATKIERQLIGWSDIIPLSWLPVHMSGVECTPPSISQPLLLYQNHCHIYPTIKIASFWNKQRISLIGTHLLIISQLSHLPPSIQNATSIFASRNQIQHLVDDICACIPFHLGGKIKPGSIGDKKVAYPHAAREEVRQSHYQMAPAQGGFQLLGPLGTLLEMGTRVEMRKGQREWIGGQVMSVARIYNLGKWVMIEILFKGMDSVLIGFLRKDVKYDASGKVI